jgi:PAS domain S-box-containing protein
MAEPPLLEIDVPAEESRRDRLLRESFVLGFVVLLALVLGMGVLAYSRIGAVENEVSRRSAQTRRDLEVVFKVQEQAGRLGAEAITLKTAVTYGAVTHPAAHRVAEARKDLDETIEAGRKLPLGQTQEWTELERGYAAFVAALPNAEVFPRPEQEVFERAVHNLLERVQLEVRDGEDEAQRMRKSAQSDVAFTTTACLLVGLVVSALSFVETRRRIALIRRAYSRVAASKEVVESTLEGMDSAVLTLSLDGVVTRINGAALHVLGHESPETVVGRSVEEALLAQPALLAMVAPVVETRNPNRRYLGRIEVGAEQWLFDVGASPLTIAGAVRGYIVTLSDVTEAERAGEELRRNRALAAVGQMTAQVAHEIKNPLGGVRLAAQVLARKLHGDEQSLEVIHRIENSVDHLNRIVAELNQFARPQELTLAPVRLDRLMDELLEMVGDRVVDKHVRVVRRYAEDLPDGQVDEGELRKAFINFLINALEASPEGAELEVAVEALGDGPDAAARVTIRDEGKGMGEETLRRLFEPFYTTKAHGTGLGMAIAKKIVDLHKGRIEVRSRVGTGTTVTVVLPLAQVAVEAVATEERP